LSGKHARKKKRRAVAARGAQGKIRAAEPRGVEALTVLWMLTAVATLMAEATAGAMAWMASSRPAESLASSPLQALPGVMLLTALTTGTLCLVLTPLVSRLRAARPPLAVTWAAVVIGLSPWIVALMTIRAA
jgi:hypothetical protein